MLRSLNVWGAIVLAMAANPVAAQAPGRVIVVTTTPVETAALPLTVEAIGAVQPIASVQIRTRVDAQIASVHVADGAAVTAGDILIKLDSRQVDAQMKQAQAQLERDAAALEQAERDVARYAQLVASKSATQVALDNAHTAVRAARAALAGDQAAIENLTVQVSYYTLRAPISGVIGTVGLKTGNVARANDNSAAGALLTINQIAPIYVAFSLPQRYLPDVRAAMNATQPAAAAPDQSPSGARVEAKPQGGARWIAGKVALIDNAIDPATGMLVARAVFENGDQALWPGQLCDLRVTLRVDDGLVVVPREAVQIGQKGHYVFVAEEGRAVLRPVRLDREQGGRGVIGEGLRPGETVVLSGANLLTNGAAIAPAKSGEPASAAKSGEPAAAVKPGASGAAVKPGAP